MRRRLGGADGLAGGRHAHDDRGVAGAVMVQGDDRAAVTLTATFSTVQPGSRDSTQGTSDADGTDWAISHNGSRSLQPTSPTPNGVPSRVLTTSLLSVQVPIGAPMTTTSAATSPISPTRRALHRWMGMGLGRLGSGRVNSPCRSRPWARSIRRSCDGNASPRAAANPSLISSMLNCRNALVDALGAGPQGQAQHHVGQVDRLPPGVGESR